MDWIEVAVNGIPHIQLDHKNPNVASLNLMQLICAMDLIKESVHQLYRVFKLEYPFKSDHSIFKDKKTDDEHFKHLRAVFGVHPVNLKGEDNSRNFASWSTPKLEGDFAAFVYSNKIGVEDQMYSIWINDLFEYTNMRYLLLEEILTKIEQDYKFHQQKYKETEINRAECSLDQLEILKRENLERHGEGEAYWHEIEELQRLFAIDIDSFNIAVKTLIEEYRDALLMVVREIHQHLQSMDIEELSTSEILDPFENFEHSYDKEKLMVYLHNPNPTYNSQLLGRMGLKVLVEEGKLPEITLKYDGDELLLLLNAWYWSLVERDKG